MPDRLDRSRPPRRKPNPRDEEGRAGVHPVVEVDHHYRLGRLRGQDHRGRRDHRELGVYGRVADGVCYAGAGADGCVGVGGDVCGIYIYIYK